MKDLKGSFTFTVSEPSDIAFIMLEAKEMASSHGFSDVDTTLISTAVSELATNILKFALTGTIQLRELKRGIKTGIEICAEDEGPGIPDIKAVLSDDYESLSGLGIGLSSIQRILDEFEIYSEPGRGTRVKACKWRDVS